MRSNFLGTEFYIYDTGKNPNKNKGKPTEENRCQHGVVQYETNVLGSKGPRRMKVFLPNVDAKGKQALWRQTTDVSGFEFKLFAADAHHLRIREAAQHQGHHVLLQQASKVERA